MPVTEAVTWVSAAVLLLVLCIVAVFAARQRPIHRLDRLDRILRDVSSRSRHCPGTGMSRDEDTANEKGQTG